MVDCRTPTEGMSQQIVFNRTCAVGKKNPIRYVAISTVVISVKLTTYRIGIFLLHRNFSIYISNNFVTQMSSSHVAPSFGDPSIRNIEAQVCNSYHDIARLGILALQHRLSALGRFNGSLESTVMTISENRVRSPTPLIFKGQILVYSSVLLR